MIKKTVVEEWDIGWVSKEEIEGEVNEEHANGYIAITLGGESSGLVECRYTADQIRVIMKSLVVFAEALESSNADN